MSYSDTRYTGPTSPSTLPDLSSAHTHAITHHEGGNSDLFSNALSFIQERASSLSEGDIDEQHAVKAHQALYGGGGDEEHHDSRSVGAASALQALKMFMSEGGGGGGGGAGSGGGFDQNALIGMAMAQAGKVWDEKESQGISMSGDKQSAINNAGEMALKMYLKSGGGIGGTGGPSGLMGLASKFLM